VKIEPGDGGSALQLVFGIDERTKTVQAAPDAAPAASSAAAPADPAAPAGSGCPAGWWLVPESVQGAQYSCRPNLPSRPLPCGGGTRYFSENGVIGCR
jgi:hypothetical protein